MHIVIISSLLVSVISFVTIWLLRQVYSLEEELYSMKDTLRKLENEKINIDMILKLIERK